MIVFLEETEFLGRLKAAGLVASTLIDETEGTGIRVWIFDGEPCTPPSPHEDGNGTQYCPHALRIFLKRLKSTQENPPPSSDLQGIETKSMKFIVKPEKK